MPDTFFVDSLGQINRKPANPNSSAVLAEFGVVAYTLTSAEIAAILALPSTDPVRVAYTTKPTTIVSASAPNNADGRPDGTIYIQSAS